MKNVIRIAPYVYCAVILLLLFTMVYDLQADAGEKIIFTDMNSKTTETKKEYAAVCPQGLTVISFVYYSKSVVNNFESGYSGDVYETKHNGTIVKNYCETVELEKLCTDEKYSAFNHLCDSDTNYGLFYLLESTLHKD